MVKTLQDVRSYLKTREKELREDFGNVIEEKGIASVEAIAAKEAWQVMYNAAYQLESDRIKQLEGRC